MLYEPRAPFINKRCPWAFSQKYMNTSITTLDNDFMKKLLNNGIIIFTIVDIMATLLIGIMSLASPVLTVTVFKKEPTVVVILVLIVVTATMFVLRLKAKTTFFVLRFVIGTVITLFILYTVFSFCRWYFTNIEGSFSFRVLTLAKKASIEDKAFFYNQIIADMIERIKLTDVPLATHLENNQLLQNPSTSTFIHTAYSAIPQLAEDNIIKYKGAYLKMMANVTNGGTVVSTDSWSYVKVGLTFIGVLVAGYFIYSLSTSEFMHNLIKKGFKNVEKTQGEAIKITQQAAKESLRAAALNKDVSRMSEILITHETKLKAAISQIESLTNDNQILTATVNNTIRHMERTTHMFNNVVRPCFQHLYVGFKAAAPNMAAQITTHLSPEQNDFITATSKIIFN